MKGRPRQPDEIKAAKGNPGRRKLNLAAGDAAQAPCPSYVKGEARRVWETLSRELHFNRVLKPTDLFTFEVLCEAFANFRRATRELAKEDFVYLTKSKHGEMRRVSPWQKIKNDAVREIRQLGEQFGLTPAMRSKVMSLQSGVATAAPQAAGETPDARQTALDLRDASPIGRLN